MSSTHTSLKTTVQPFIKNNTKRVKKDPYLQKTYKHIVQAEYVQNIARFRFSSGHPITVAALTQGIIAVFGRKTEEETEEHRAFRETYLEKADSMKRIRTFILRSVTKVGMTLRKQTVSQSVPRDWMQLRK
uniref:Uncharacterized protein n=1 Tax=Grammatophora oceanica TaxID=210454 RepID=A0A7S1Y903_9STRA|mmetsp:Transcript_33809/g.50127  ORF Transcript_33809/g.50127 Transcript_33809/m.50127 type:complete len:131 (+) Transcript_33809:585-977(+)